MRLRQRQNQNHFWQTCRSEKFWGLVVTARKLSSAIFSEAIVNLLIWMPFSYRQTPQRYCVAVKLTLLGLCLVFLPSLSHSPALQKKGQLHSWVLERCVSLLARTEIIDNLHISPNSVGLSLWDFSGNTHTHLTVNAFDLPKFLLIFF